MADSTNADALSKQKNSNNGKKKSNMQQPRNKTSKYVPKPKKISTTETTLVNDPLWIEEFNIDGEMGLVSAYVTKNFEADAAGYLHLIESEYNAISDVEKYYAKSISQSAHTYYHIILYWYKIALIARRNGTASLAQDWLIQFVQGYGSAQIASGAGKYLEGLGDFTDAMGVKHRLHAVEPNDHGHFGRITHANHGLYETLPAPAIALQRVAADIAISQRGADRDVEWMLAGLAPAAPRAEPPAPQAHAAAAAQRAAAHEEAEVGGDDEDEEGGAKKGKKVEPAPPPQPQPTVNLLGWCRATVLSANQLSDLRYVIDEKEPREGLVNQRYSVRRELFEFVECKLRECKRYELSIIPATTGGSIVQQVIWKPLEISTSRHQQAITTVGTAMSSTMLPLWAVIAAKVMCYRTLRREIEDEDGAPVNSWACYSFNRYRTTPENWVNNRNALVQRGFDNLINYTPFQTPIAARTDTLLKYLNKFKTSYE